MKMWIMNLGKPTKLPPLSESMAIDLGSQILGEAVIFLLAAVLICVEYSRQAHNEEKKEEMNKQELNKLDYKIQQLNAKVEEQVLRIKGLHHTIYKITSHKSDGVNPPPVSIEEERSDFRLKHEASLKSLSLFEDYEETLTKNFNKNVPGISKTFDSNP